MLCKIRCKSSSHTRYINKEAIWEIDHLFDLIEDAGLEHLVLNNELHVLETSLVFNIECYD